MRVLVGSLLVLALAGCASPLADTTGPGGLGTAGDVTTPSAPVPSASVPPASASTAAPVPTDQGSAARADVRPAAVEPCRADQLGRARRAWGAHLGGAELVADVTLTHVSGPACTLSGWPAVALESRRGTRLTVERLGGPGRTVTVAPGRDVRFSIVRVNGLCSDSRTASSCACRRTRRRSSSTRPRSAPRTRGSA